jgi:hypothetical protein
MRLKIDVAALREAAPTLVRDVAGLGGCGLVAYGAGLIYHPAGFIIGGLFLMAGAFLSARAKA